MNRTFGNRTPKDAVLVVALAVLATVLGALHLSAPLANANRTTPATVSRGGPVLDGMPVTDVPSCVSYLVGLAVASQDDASTACQAAAAAVPDGISFGFFFGCLQDQVVGGSTPDAALSSCQARFSGSTFATVFQPPATVSGSSVANAAGSCSWTGKWMRAESGHTLTLTQSGSQVTGDDGEGKDVNGAVAGNHLTGRWTYGSDFGTIDWTMDSSCNKFTGTHSGNMYGGLSGELGRSTYTATRVGAAPPPTTGSPSGGDCDQWHVDGSWQVQQQGGYTPTFRLQQSGQNVTGTLTFSDSDRDRAGLSANTYTVAGSVNGATFDVTVTGPNRKDGKPVKSEYTATVSLRTLSNGTLSDLTSGTSFTWSASGSSGYRFC